MAHLYLTCGGMVILSTVIGTVIGALPTVVLVVDDCATLKQPFTFRAISKDPVTHIEWKRIGTPGEITIPSSSSTNCPALPSKDYDVYRYIFQCNYNRHEYTMTIKNVDDDIDSNWIVVVKTSDNKAESNLAQIKLCGALSTVELVADECATLKQSFTFRATTKDSVSYIEWKRTDTPGKITIASFSSTNSTILPSEDYDSKRYTFQCDYRQPQYKMTINHVEKDDIDSNWTVVVKTSVNKAVSNHAQVKLCRSNEPSMTPSKHQHGLSSGVIIGIVIASLLTFASLPVFFCLVKRKDQKKIPAVLKKVKMGEKVHRVCFVVDPPSDTPPEQKDRQTEEERKNEKPPECEPGKTGSNTHI